jgi:hypothetical protein
VSDEVSVWVPGKAFPEEPIDFEDIDDPDLKRVCEKLLKMLSHDPWNEFKNYHDETRTHAGSNTTLDTSPTRSFLSPCYVL